MESEAIGAYRAATLVRLTELRESMVSQIEKIVPKEDSYDRTCSVIALHKVQELWRLAISDFEISVGHTLPEIQVQSLMKEKDRLNQRLNNLFETVESLYRLVLGPLPPDVSDDMTLVSRLNVECKHLRRRLVENQHKLIVPEHAKGLDVEHVSLKQLWKIAQNALEQAARAKAFGVSADGTNVKNEALKLPGVSSSSSSPSNKKHNNNNNKEHEEGEEEMTLEDYKKEIGISREIYDLRLALRKKTEELQELQSSSRATEVSLKTKIAEVRARFLTEIDKIKMRNGKYLKKLDQLHEEELKSLITQVLAALGVSDPVSVEERIEETLENLREKREKSLEQAMLSAKNRRDGTVNDLDNEDEDDSDGEVLGDEEDADHGDQPPSPTQRSLTSTYRPGGVHKWEGETMEGLKARLEEQTKQSNIQHANFMVQVKAKTLEWQTQLQDMQQQYEAEKLALNSDLLREKGRITNLTRQVDDLTKENQKLNKTVSSLRQQLDASAVEAAQSTKIALLGARRETDQRMKELTDSIGDKKDKIESLQKKLQEYSVRFGNKSVMGMSSVMKDGSYCRDMWMQTDPVEFAEDVQIFRSKRPSRAPSRAASEYGGGSDFDNDAEQQGSFNHFDEEQNEMISSARSALRKGVKRVGMVSRLGAGGGAGGAKNAREFDVDNVVIPETSRVSREQNPHLDVFGNNTSRHQKQQQQRQQQKPTDISNLLFDKNANATNNNNNDNSNLSPTTRSLGTMDHAARSQSMWNSVMNHAKTPNSSPPQRNINGNNNNNTRTDDDDDDDETELMKMRSPNSEDQKQDSNIVVSIPRHGGDDNDEGNLSSTQQRKRLLHKQQQAASNSTTPSNKRGAKHSSSPAMPLGSMRKNSPQDQNRQQQKNQSTKRSNNNNNNNNNNTRHSIPSSSSSPHHHNHEDDDVFDDDMIYEDEDEDEDVNDQTPPKRQNNNNNTGQQQSTTTTTKKQETLLNVHDSNSQLTRVGSANLTPLEIRDMNYDNQQQQSSSSNIRNNNNNNNTNQNETTGTTTKRRNQSRRSVVLLDDGFDPTAESREADLEERAEAQLYENERRRHNNDDDDDFSSSASSSSSSKDENNNNFSSSSSSRQERRVRRRDQKQQQKTAIDLLATQGPVTVNDTLLTPESVQKTLEVFNTPAYNDSERMKALVVTSTMKPVAVGALPTSVSEKRFFLALSRVASFCDTVLVLPRNALPYSVRLQQQLKALGASKAPEDWRMMKKISPMEICIISTYISANFSRRSEKMRLLLRQISNMNNNANQNQNQQQQQHSSAAAASLGPNANSPSGHHAQSQRLDKLENIFSHADAVISKVRSASMSDQLKDVTWDELQRWQQIDAENHLHSGASVSSRQTLFGNSSRPSSQGGKNSPIGHNNNQSIMSSFPARDASQLLVQIFELLRLWNAQKRQLVEQFAAHSRKASLFDKSFSNFTEDEELKRRGKLEDGSYVNPEDNYQQQQDEEEDAEDFLMSSQKRKGSAIFRGSTVRGVAPSASVMMAKGSSQNKNNNNTPTPPLTFSSKLAKSARISSEHENNNSDQNSNNNNNNDQMMAVSARVRNPRSIRQLIAASNTLVRSARRHVEAQRQASVRGESPQFTQDSLVDLRVVGNTSVKK